jgi:hypothetical protein
MRYVKVVVSVVGVLLLLSLSMYGSAHNKTFINIAEPVMVAGRQLAPGEYRVEWTGVGPSSQVTFSRDGRVVVTTTASVRDQSNPYDGPAVVTGLADGSKALKEIDLPKQAIILQQPNETAQK